MKKRMKSILLGAIFVTTLTDCRFEKPVDENITPDMSKTDTTKIGQDAMPDLHLPDMGNSTLPDMGDSTLPDMGNSTLPDAGNSTSPSVVDITPASNAKDINPDIVIRVLFSEPMKEASLQASFSLHAENQTEPVQGQLRIENANKIIFTPDRPLVLFGKYTITLSTDAQDQAGNALVEEKISTFQIREGKWHTPTLLDKTDTVAYFPEIAMDQKGNAIAVWRESSHTASKIYANRFSVTRGTWGKAELISTLADVSHPKIAMDQKGNAIVIWDSSSSNVYTNRFSVTRGTWGKEVLIQTNVAVFNPEIAMDPKGNAIAVWENAVENGAVGTDPVGSNLYANRFSVTNGTWGQAKRIKGNNTNNTNNTKDVYAPEIAMDPKGNAIVVWRKDEAITSSSPNIYANRFSVTRGTWSSAVPLENKTGPARSTEIAMDPKGNAIVVWEEESDASVYANRFSVTRGKWGSAVLIEKSAEIAIAPVIAMDENGTAIAVWRQLGDSGYNVYANHFTPQKGWNTQAVLIENNTGNTKFPGYPDIAMDKNGNAIAVWVESDTAIYANRFSVTGGKWGSDVSLKTMAENVRYPKIVMDQEGKAIVVWRQKDGGFYNIYASRFE